MSTIPKVIHYCWLSGKPISKKYKQYMDTWKDTLQGYEMKLWDQKSFDVESHPFVKRCIEAKDWAHASDYIRLWVLYNYGGIYLDCDVIVYKNFDDLLHLPYAFGLELDNHINPWLLETAVMMSQPGNKFIKKCLDHYDNVDFNDIRLISIYMREVMIKNRYRVRVVSKNNWQDLGEQYINVFPKDYFSPKFYKNPDIKVSDNTYCCHMFNNGWFDTKGKGYEFNNNTSNVRFKDSKPDMVGQ